MSHTHDVVASYTKLTYICSVCVTVMVVMLAVVDDDY